MNSIEKALRSRIATLETELEQKQSVIASISQYAMQLEAENTRYIDREYRTLPIEINYDAIKDFNNDRVTTTTIHWKYSRQFLLSHSRLKSSKLVEEYERERTKREVIIEIGKQILSSPLFITHGFKRKESSVHGNEMVSHNLMLRAHLVAPYGTNEVTELKPNEKMLNENLDEMFGDITEAGE